MSKPNICYANDFNFINELLDFDENEGGILVFGEMLDLNQKAINPFFTKRRYKQINVLYLSQPYCDLPEITKRNNSKTTNLTKQTLKGVENFYRDITGLDVSYEPFKELYREARKDQIPFIFFWLDLNRRM